MGAAPRPPLYTGRRYARAKVWAARFKIFIGWLPALLVNDPSVSYALASLFEGATLLSPQIKAQRKRV